MNAKTMRKATAALAVALAICTTASAQNAGRSLRLGLSFAPNLGWLSPSGKKIEANGSHLGFRFGLLTDIMIGENANYAFSTGLFLNNIGGDYKREFDAAPSDTLTVLATEQTTLKLQYVELPLTIKLKTNEIGYMTYFGQIGFDTGFRVGAKRDTEIASAVAGYSKTEDNEDAKDDAAELRVALVVGAGIEYNFSGNTSALVGLKYSNGFTNALDNDDLGQAKLHYAELTLGVLF